jgi:hypothetical protein
MATATLVNSNIEVGRRIVAALTRASIPVSVYLWAFIPELDEWRFIVATPLVDLKGPLEAYNEVNKALQRGGIIDDITLMTVYLRSPNDRVLKALEKESKGVAHETFRVVNASIAGNFVEDAYLYHGSLDITALSNARGVAPSKYSVVYVPYSGGGTAPSKQIDGEKGLKEFLENRTLHLRTDMVESTIKELLTSGSTSISNVQLRTQDLKRLGML